MLSSSPKTQKALRAGNLNAELVELADAATLSLQDPLGRHVIANLLERTLVVPVRCAVRGRLPAHDRLAAGRRVEGPPRHEARHRNLRLT